ncbi:MAG: TIGR00341 family protein [Planctomycetota bacterium]|nr:TIGR00341 family protein [Planctomycetota bacterium]
MALRLLDVVLPEGSFDALKGAFREDVIQGGPWRHSLIGGSRLMRVLIDAEDSGRLVDAIEQRCGELPGFSLTIQRVEAALPRPVERDETPSARRSAFGPKQRTRGLSREELFSDVRDMARTTRVFIVTVVLSTVVASVGLLANDAAAIIGAMVIAPLLGPNVGLALAATLADGKLFRHALKANVYGLAIALGMTIPLGLLLLGEAGSEITARTQVDLGDPILALAAGAAGTLAVTTGVPMSLVGVMVAVALLPPTAVLGLMIGGQRFDAVGGASLLLLTNMLCIVFAGAITFRLTGVRPSTWWEAERARRSSRLAIVILGVLLVLVTLMIARLAG